MTIELPDEEFVGDNEMVVIGGELSQPTEVSVQLLQDVYNELTGRTEELSRSYSKSIRLNFEDIQQLNRKIEQLFEQYHIKGKNCVVTIYHENDQKEVYSGFERFSLHVSEGSNKPVESLALVYSFLVILPKTNRAKTYKIELRFSSRITLLKKLKAELPFDLPSPIFKVMAGRTAEIKIEYVDYVVARTFLDAFEDWIQTVQVSRPVAWLNFLRKHSQWVPVVAKYSLGGLGAYFVWLSINHYFTEEVADIYLFAKLVFWSLLSVFSLYRAGLLIGNLASNGLDKTMDLSYIELTKGDKEQIKEAEILNKKSMLKVFGSIALTVVLGVVSSIIANQITS